MNTCYSSTVSGNWQFKYITIEFKFWLYYETYTFPTETFGSLFFHI